MPSTRIVTGHWAVGKELALIEAVQSALQEAIKIPDWDRDVVVDVYGAQHRIVPTGKSALWTRVEIHLFSGRSADAKRALYLSIVHNLAALGVPGDHIKIILIEVDAVNWGLRGGIPASEIDFGFKIDV